MRLCTEALHERRLAAAWDCAARCCLSRLLSQRALTAPSLRLSSWVEAAKGMLIMI